MKIVRGLMTIRTFASTNSIPTFPFLQPGLKAKQDYLLLRFQLTAFINMQPALCNLSLV